MKYSPEELTKKSVEMLNELLKCGDTMEKVTSDPQITEDAKNAARMEFAGLVGKCGTYLDHLMNSFQSGLKQQGMAFDAVDKALGNKFDSVVLKAMQEARVDIACGCEKNFDENGVSLKPKDVGRSSDMEMLAKLLGLDSLGAPPKGKQQ